MSSPRSITVCYNKLHGIVIVVEYFTVFFFYPQKKTHKTTILFLKERHIFPLFPPGLLRQKTDVWTQQLANGWSITRGN